MPAINKWSDDPTGIKDGRKVAEDFVYTSDRNPEWMDDATLAGWIAAHSEKIGAI